MGSTDLGQHRSDGRALSHGPVAGNETRQVARASYTAPKPSPARGPLLALGDSPYQDIRAVMVAGYERNWNSYERVPAYAARGEMPMNLMVTEYSLMDKINAAAGTLDTFMTVYPQLADIDFRVQAKELSVPVYLVEGLHEARGRAVLAREWYDLLQAPAKQWITFDNSGHRPLFEEPDRFFEVMTGTVLAGTS